MIADVETQNEARDEEEYVLMDSVFTSTSRREGRAREDWGPGSTAGTESGTESFAQSLISCKIWKCKQAGAVLLSRAKSFWRLELR